jgi:hypothetical protein
MEVALNELMLKLEPPEPLTIAEPAPVMVAPWASAALSVSDAELAKVTLMVPPTVVPLISTVSLSMVTPFKFTLNEDPVADVFTVPIFPSWLTLTVRVTFALNWTVDMLET